MGEIVIAPLSHNRLRDWPVRHYVQLVGLLLEQTGAERRVTIVGTPNQRSQANAIVRNYPLSRVDNACGTMAFPDLLDRLRGADCVIGNNSGVTHVSRHMGVPTICIFGGSHQRTDWGPLGPNATILSRVIGCAPCHLNYIWECPYDVACLDEISPTDVLEACLVAMDGRVPSAPGASRDLPL